MGGHENELDGVLGLLAGAEHVPTEGEDPRQVALVEDLAGGCVPRPYAGEELRVPARGQQPLGAAQERAAGSR